MLGSQTVSDKCHCQKGNSPDLQLRSQSQVIPKNNSGRDVMLDAPSELDPKQLDELEIKLDLKAE